MIDAHCHLVDEAFDPDREQIIQSAFAAGIKVLINVCTNSDELERAFHWFKSEPRIPLVAATPPHDVRALEDPFFQQVESWLQEKKIVAIGETGLDYYRDTTFKEAQKACLARYISLAQTKQAPMVIHCRDAFDDLIELFDRMVPGFERVMIHCFTGNERDLRAVIERKWMVSISGIVTFKKSEPLQSLLPKIPLSQLLIETDAPYLAPVPFRGQRCEPRMIGSTFEFVASFLKIPPEELIPIISQNAKRFFSLSNLV